MASEEANGVIVNMNEVTELLAAETVLDVGIDGVNGVDGYGAIENDVVMKCRGKGEKKAKGDKNDKADKKGKKAKKAIADLLKVDMASERTFFKWFRTGLQIGAIGTFVFIALDKKEGSLWRFAVVAFAWLIGLLLVLYGVYAYYQRRAAIRNGEMEEVADFMRDHSPILVVASLVLVVGAGLAYALFTGQEPSKNSGVIIPYVPAPQDPQGPQMPQIQRVVRGRATHVRKTQRRALRLPMSPLGMVPAAVVGDVF